MTSPVLPITLAALGSAVALAPAQTWVDRTERPAIGLPVYADGGPGGSPVTFRDGELLTFSGRAWRSLGGLHPNINGLTDIAHDRQRGKSVVLATAGPSFAFTIFELDGAGWTQHGPVPTGANYDLVYDPALGGVVLFTSDMNLGTTQDHLWNGTAWLALPPNVRPYHVQDQVVADFARSQLVAFTPDWPGPAGETYTWDGVSWSLASPAISPPIRRAAAMAHDEQSGTVMLFGGASGTAWLRDTWRWDGVTWSRIAATTPSPATESPALVFDRARGAMALLVLDDESTSDYVWTGTAWQVMAPSPPLRARNSVATDPVRGRLVLYETGNTHLWDGIAWSTTQAGGPSRRYSPMAFDYATAELVVFGGHDYVIWPVLSFTTFGDTWTWNGAQWSQRTPPVTPPARMAHALVSRAATPGVVLFGGKPYVTGTPLGDTWIWNGGTWTQQTGLPASPPPGECIGASGPPGSDPHVLAQGEVWQFAGAWNLVSNQLPPINTAAIATTPAGTPMLIGVENSGPACYEFVAGTWIQRPSPPAYLGWTAFDPLRGNVMSFDPNRIMVLTQTPATVDEVGTGCGSPPPQLLAEGVPRIGSPAFAVHVDAVQGVALFAADFASAPTPLGGGCTSWLGNPFLLGVTIPNAYSVAALSVPIPASSGLRGLTFHVQALGPQAGGPFGGFALSAAIRIVVGD